MLLSVHVLAGVCYPVAGTGGDFSVAEVPAACEEMSWVDGFCSIFAYDRVQVVGAVLTWYPKVFFEAAWISDFCNHFVQDCRDKGGGGIFAWKPKALFEKQMVTVKLGFDQTVSMDDDEIIQALSATFMHVSREVRNVVGASDNLYDMMAEEVQALLDEFLSTRDEGKLSAAQMHKLADLVISMRERVKEPIFLLQKPRRPPKKNKCG